MTSIEKYKDIDLSKLPENAKEKVKIASEVLLNPLSQKPERKAELELAEKNMETLYNAIKAKYPDALKSLQKKEPEPTTPVAKAKKIAKQNIEPPKKGSTKATVNPSKRGNVTTLAKEIRKEGEAWKDAIKRAGEMISKQQKVVVKQANKQFDKLQAFLDKHPELKNVSVKRNSGKGTPQKEHSLDVRRDASRPAKKAGRRVSADGNVYYEYRENRVDRFSKKYPMLAKGGKVKGGEKVYNVWAQIEEIDEAKDHYETLKDEQVLVYKSYDLDESLHFIQQISSKYKSEILKNKKRLSGKHYQVWLMPEAADYDKDQYEDLDDAQRAVMVFRKKEEAEQFINSLKNGHFAKGGKVKKGEYKVEIYSTNYPNTDIMQKTFTNMKDAVEFAYSVDDMNDDGFYYNIYGLDSNGKKLIKVYGYEEYNPFEDTGRGRELKDENYIKRLPKYKDCVSWQLDMVVASFPRNKVIFTKTFDTLRKATKLADSLGNEPLVAHINDKFYEEFEEPEYAKGGKVGKKHKYFVDLIDGKITTGKVHPNYKGFGSLKEAEEFSEKYKKGEIQYAKGGKVKGRLSDTHKYVPNRMIQEIEVERKGKTTFIDGADILDGVYVRKGVKFAAGGIPQKYTITVWETEEDRDAGESFIAETLSDLKEATARANKLYYSMGYAAVEVIDANDEVVLHLSDDSFADGGMIPNQRTNIEFNSYLATAYAEGFEEAPSKDAIIEAWAYLIASKLAYQMQGWFGRTANSLIEQGYIDENGHINWEAIDEANEYAKGGEVEEEKIWEIIYKDKGVQKSILVEGYSAIIETNNWRRQNPTKEFIQIQLYGNKYAKGGELDINKYAGAGMFSDGGMLYDNLRKRFEGYTDEELQIFNGDNEETLKNWNREDAIEEAIHSVLEESDEYAKGGKTKSYSKYVVRKDLRDENTSVPVGNTYVSDGVYEGRYNDDGTFEIKMNGKWQEAESVDWEKYAKGGGIRHDELGGGKYKYGIFTVSEDGKELGHIFYSDNPDLEFDPYGDDVPVSVGSNQMVRRLDEYAKGGKVKGRLSDTHKYVPNRMIQEIEVERKGKTTFIDGADILDGVYVRKGVKFAAGGEVANLEVLKLIEAEFGHAPQGADIRALRDGIVEVYYYSPNVIAENWAMKIKDKYGDVNEDYNVTIHYIDTANMKNKFAKGGEINMNRHIWEGWTVGDFIEALEIPFQYHPKFKSKDEVKKWAMSEQPYYKKYIKEVVDYYWNKNENKYEDGGYIPEGEDYEYVNSFGIPQEDFVMLVDAWHKNEYANSKEAEREYFDILNRLEAKFGVDNITDIVIYIEDTHHRNNEENEMGEYATWKMDVADELSNIMNVDYSDAQGIMDVNSFVLAKSWGINLSPKETAMLIYEKNEERTPKFWMYYTELIQAVMDDINVSEEEATKLVDKYEYYLTDMIEYIGETDVKYLADIITNNEETYAKGGYMAHGGNLPRKSKNKIKLHILNIDAFDKFYDEVGYLPKELALPKQDTNKIWYTSTNDESIAEILINDGYVQRYSHGGTLPHIKNKSHRNG